MSTMTPEAALALRQPFPKESVGRLPKPYKADSPKGNCNDCGGYHGLPAVHLDYVGHAAATDRLLTVDPDWNWEPFAVHPQSGLPLLDEKGNLWIRLTVCGVTRIGIGDGKSLKECIGDAIRNAAMRFGVALDLWAKENLVEFAQAAREHRVGTAGLRAAVDQPPASDPGPEPPAKLDAPAVEPKLTQRRRATLFATLTRKGCPEDRQAEFIAQTIGRTPAHRDAITQAECDAVLARLDTLTDKTPEGEQS